MIQSVVQLPVIVALLAFFAAATSESVLEILLRVTGLTASPALMRGPGDEVDPGDIWVVSPGGAPPTALTSGGGYRSPIFSPVDGSIVALNGDTVVRIPASGGAVERVRDVPGVVKLVGFEAKNGDDVVVLLEGGGSPLGVLSLKTGKVVSLSYDAKSDDERRMLEQIRGQERVYGNVSVYVKTESKRRLSRIIEWTDVYLQRGDSQPQNVSACDGVRCGQPSLSPDGRRVAFVKSGD
jgi:hypothetical protein